MKYPTIREFLEAFKGRNDDTEVVLFCDGHIVDFEEFINCRQLEPILVKTKSNPDRIKADKETVHYRTGSGGPIT